MIDASDIKVSSQHLESDVRLEIIANELLGYGVDIDQILVSPLGGFYRGSRRDIVEMGIIKDSIGGVLYHQIKTSRDGLYDGLPENIFHDNQDDILAGKLIDPIENVKKNREEEEAARKFFQVVEKEFYRLRIQFEQEERKSILGSSEFYRHEIFVQLWSELKELDGKYIPALMQILPLACKYHSDTRRMEVLPQKLLDVGVRIEHDPIDSTKEEVNKITSLGGEYLGIDTIIGKTYYDFEPGYLVNLGPLTPEELEDLMPGCTAQKALNVFCEYFFPVGARLKFNYIMLETQNTINLNPDQPTGSGLARLGLSSYL
jgi:type VI secretion system protein ImpH